jgi:hypothetical protein
MIARTLCVFLWFTLPATLVPAAEEIPKPEHPTPDAAREHWANLNGRWQFRFDARDEGLKAEWFQPDAQGFDQTIIVPFGWESELSGIHQPKGAPQIGWYRRTFTVPEDFPKDDRVWLRFGAVDERADVWVNGKKVAEHDGGYTPFEADITDALKPEGPNTLVVRAFDPTDPSHPTGKQVHWYTTTSGIWQTVWLESRPKAHLASFTIRTLALDPARVEIEFAPAGLSPGNYTIAVRSEDSSIVPQESALRPFAGGPGATMRQGLVVPIRNPKLWSPESPHLYDVTLELKGPDGKVDAVKTYFGLRTIARGKYGNEPFERILLNGKPVYLRGALDQSFNPKGIYTAPSDEFLKADIAAAKRFGLNMLRIHIKPDEPRRLYWADKLGLLILQDMPNTWEQNATARKTWEHTMREAVARDRNHPSLIAWVAFNETWGLGQGGRYKNDRDTQQWVSQMVSVIHELDPTRLVEDNSACNYDHVETTDLNSWHFYIDNSAESRRHIEDVVAQTQPGSGFNYCPGLKQGTAPLINSEYGAVSASGGDRDISWGFRDLTTQLRRHPKIQGYVYTELTDVEWEHNGLLNYDRTPKTFGYDAFVPGMTVADLQGADFIGYDAPPAIVAKPGQEVTVPLFVSHYSERTSAPKLRWEVRGIDDRDPQKEISWGVHGVPITWTPYGVNTLSPISFRVGERPFVGALALRLEDERDRPIALNFVNIVVQPDRPLPRVERVDDHKVIVRFAPGEFARRRWSGSSDVKAGMAWGEGKGFFEYRLKLPETVIKAGPKTVELMFEASAKAGRERVDWPERTNPQDNPQTDTRKWPSTLEIALDGQTLRRETLPDDPADARGVLSHLARVRHGSYGELIRLNATVDEGDRARLASGRPLTIRLSVPDDAAHPGGLCLYGAEAGRYPIDLTLTITTEKALPSDLGVPADRPVTVETAVSRRIWLLPSGDSPQGRPPVWAYTTANPGPPGPNPTLMTGPGGAGNPASVPLSPRPWWSVPLGGRQPSGSGRLLNCRRCEQATRSIFISSMTRMSRCSSTASRCSAERDT